MYGILPSPCTTPTDAGTPPAAPSATTGAAGTSAYSNGYTPGWVTIPARAAWASRSQWASLRACQMPLKSGRPSAVRAMSPPWAAGRITEAVMTALATAAAMATLTIDTFLVQLRMRDLLRMGEATTTTAALGREIQSRWAASLSPISTPPAGKYSRQRRVTRAAVSSRHATSRGNPGLSRASITTGGV